MTSKNKSSVLTLDPKTAYDLSKAISNSKVISDELIASMVITMFIDYLRTYAEPKEAAKILLNFFKEKILSNKLAEFSSLDENVSSVSDMMVVSEIINSDDMVEYRSTLDVVISSVEATVLEQLILIEDEEDKDNEDNEDGEE